MPPGTVKNKALGYTDYWSDLMQLHSLLLYGHETHVCAVTGSYGTAKGRRVRNLTSVGSSSMGES